jgi:hypothetical protein
MSAFERYAAALTVFETGLRGNAPSRVGRAPAIYGIS